MYPYACSYHPGMTGAIVVGSGSGAGNGEAVSVAAFQQPAAASPVVEVRTVTKEAGGAPIAIGWVVGGAIGLALGIGSRRSPGEAGGPRPNRARARLQRLGSGVRPIARERDPGLLELQREVVGVR